jgi:hypothetical protein
MLVGEYSLSAALPENLAGGKKRAIRLTRAGACSEQVFTAANLGRVRGKLQDVSGQPVVHQHVELMPAENMFKNPQYALSDALGVFQFTGVRPGNYVVAINVTWPPSARYNTSRFPRTFLPGTPNRSGARAIGLGIEGTADDLMFQLPKMMPERPVRGRVRWRNGTPVEGARVTLLDPEYTREVDICWRTAADGGFSVTGFAGIRYVLTATFRATSGEEFKSGPVEVPLDSLSPSNFILDLQGSN